MKKIIKVLIFITILSINSIAYASTAIHLKIETDTGIVYENNMDVAPCDSEGITEPTAYCALAQSGIPSDWNGAYGPLWINSINEIENNTNNNGIYWMWLVNLNINNPYSDFTCHQDAPYSCSAKQYILKPNDNILFYYNIDPLTPVTPPAPTPEPTPVPEPTVLRSSGGGSRIIVAPIITPELKPFFDIKKASDFLISQQKENGSFGEDLYTDWTAIALAPTNYVEQIAKLTKYLGENKIENPSLTDYERHAIALMSLGLNPHNINGENYIEKIVSSFDGIQFGDVHEDNDDIFALIVLQNAGYTINDKIISNDLAFVLKAQNTDGSWDNSVDMTGAALQGIINITDESCFLFGSLSVSADTALPLDSSACETPKNKELSLAINKAREFLKQNQKEDGGWGNASSTAWVIEGILALNEKIEDWTKNGNTPLDYLATIQDTDGGIKDENLQNKIWKTAYVTSALSGKTWNQIMQKFEKQTIIKIENIQKKTIVETSIKSPKKITKNKKFVTTATVINAVDHIDIVSQTEQKEVPQKNWFVKLIENIFSIF